MESRDIRDKRLAVLIDADNVSHQYLESFLDEVARYGIPTIKRIYGDWTRPNLNGWKSKLLNFAITPIQQFSYTQGKNSTDSSLIIDAMDILYSNRVDGFCLVSSDSDFTRLATRLREAGMSVYGFGEEKTPISFISACEKFIYLEILNPVLNKNTDESQLGSFTNTKPITKKIDNRVKNLILSTIDDLADETGWSFLGDVGNLVIKKQPNFDARVYGYQKLSSMIRDISNIEIDERSIGKSNIKHIYVRRI